ncbi:hypothetical protein QE152_g8638 [Popillia japonica]|uniref:Cadherin domain-containing protein n=1 Tax=Popillia japonica TaxID=7064 RepID=A0AAW1M2H2_POPJA
MINNEDLLPAGLYEFTVTATGDLSGASVTQPVTITVVAVEDTITVDSDEVCDDGARVTYSLLVKNIEENSAQILLPSAYPDENIAYILEINDVSPSAGAGRFYVSEDGQSIGCQALDRESSDFAGMAVTQYTVTISVTELDGEEVTNQNYRNNVARISNETYVQSLASSRADSEQYILINDILNSPTRTIITIIVEDVNDNRPVFPVTSMVVGYPSSTLLSVIAPPYIVQVEATDDDIGINAELAYEVSDSPVIIHSSSGIVYPTDGMPDNDFTFTVRATDQNGEGLLSSNSLQVQVKILGEEHISILTLENVFLEDIDEKLSRLSQVANVDIKQLTASVLPSTTITNRQLRADEKYYLIITVYALDSSNDLVTTEQLQEALANVAGLSVVTLPKASSDGNSSDNSSDSNTGLIAAVAVLAAILLLLLIGFLAFYYFRLRKNKPHDHMTEENAPSTGTSTPPQYQKNIAMTRSSSKLSHLGQDIEKMERRPTGILITGAVGAPDDDSPPVSPPKERRKSVVFNANVEQINIDTSRDSDDGIESSKL